VCGRVNVRREGRGHRLAVVGVEARDAPILPRASESSRCANVCLGRRVIVDRRASSADARHLSGDVARLRSRVTPDDTHRLCRCRRTSGRRRRQPDRVRRTSGKRSGRDRRSRACARCGGRSTQRGVVARSRRRASPVAALHFCPTARPASLCRSLLRANRVHRADTSRTSVPPRTVAGARLRVNRAPCPASRCAARYGNDGRQRGRASSSSARQRETTRAASRRSRRRELRPCVTPSVTLIPLSTSIRRDRDLAGDLGLNRRCLRRIRNGSCRCVS
jgi:hypothetical protein